MDFVTEHWAPGPLPEPFRDWALAHELWEKTWGNSLFLQYYEAARPWESGGVSIWARDPAVFGDRPIAVAHAEFRNETLQAIRYKWLRDGITMGKKHVPLDWNLQVIGKIGLYVTPEARGRGLAVELLRRAEDLLMARAVRAMSAGWTDRDLPVIVARERAYELARKHLAWCQVFQDDKACYRRYKDITHQANDRVYLDAGDARGPYGSKAQPAWRDFHALPSLHQDAGTQPCLAL